MSFEKIKKIIKKSSIVLFGDTDSLLFPDNGPERKGFQFGSISKIGTIEAKKNIISIYNLYVQVYLEIPNLDKSKLGIEESLTISVGNVNSAGLA